MAIEKGKQEAFLRELAELTSKYEIAISGCGCCGSPSIHQADAGGKYTVDEYGDDLTYGD